MYCKDLLKRHKQSKIVFYCRHDKRYIVSLLACENCLNKDFKRNSPIKKVTDKQKELNKNRFSIFTTNFNKCFYCGKEGKMDIHEVYGGSNRTRSIKNGLVVPLCRLCHSNERIIHYLRIMLQKEYEKRHSREDFVSIIGKNYIKEEN